MPATARYQLSLLDKSPIPAGASAEQALASTVRLAHLLARTRSIRIGSGGVMLQHYSPYKVAEVFKVLAALAPGRVDLGMGKAPGGLPLSTRALQAGFDAAKRPDRLLA